MGKALRQQQQPPIKGNPGDNLTPQHVIEQQRHKGEFVIACGKCRAKAARMRRQFLSRQRWLKPFAIRVGRGGIRELTPPCWIVRHLQRRPTGQYIRQAIMLFTRMLTRQHCDL
jgi:hypothetical protein